MTECEQRQCRLYRLGKITGIVAVVLVLAMATLLLLGQLLLPLAARYPDQLARFVSARIGQPVHIAHMQGTWHLPGPQLRAEGVEIGGSGNTKPLRLSTVRIHFDFGALLSPTRHFVTIYLKKIHLRITRASDGVWRVNGLSLDYPPRDWRYFSGALRLDKAHVSVADAKTGYQGRWQMASARLDNQLGTVRFHAQAKANASNDRVSIAGKLSQNGRQGRLRVTADGADLAALFQSFGRHELSLEKGKGAITLWANWHTQENYRITVHANIDRMMFERFRQSVTVPAWQGWVRLTHKGRQTDVLFAPDQDGAIRMRWQGGRQSFLLASARQFTVNNWLKTMVLMPWIPDKLQRWVKHAHPQAIIESGQLVWKKEKGLTYLHAKLANAGFAAVGDVPGVTPFRGVVQRTREGSFVLTLPAQPLTLDFTSLFRWPLHANKIKGRIVVIPERDQWQLRFPEMTFQGKGFNGQASGRISIPSSGERPTVDLRALLDEGDIARAKQFLPVGVMSDSVVQWLDQALVGGTVEHANLILRGNLAHWPFKKGHGLFKVTGDVHDATMDYLDDWPVATGINGKVKFEGTGMQITADSGQVAGIDVNKSEALIPDLMNPELKLTIEGEGKGQDMLNLVTHTPLGSDYKTSLDALQYRGQNTFTMSLSVPLESDHLENEYTLDGHITTHKARLAYPPGSVAIKALTGSLAFTQNGIKGQNLSAQFLGQLVRLNLTVGKGLVAGHPAWPLKVTLDGNFSIQQLTHGYPQLQPLVALSNKKARFKLGFHIDRDAENALGSPYILHLLSDLKGMSLSLPAPLDKAPGKALPLDIQLGFLPRSTRGIARIGKQIHTRFQWHGGENSDAAVAVILGQGKKPSFPLPEGISVQGNIDAVDISGWLQKAMHQSFLPTTRKPSVQVDMTTKKATLFDASLGPMHIQLHPDKQQWQVNVAGPNIQGHIQVPRGQGALKASFTRLYWPYEHDLLGSMRTSDKKSVPTRQTLNPARLPPIQWRIDDFRLGNLILGKTLLATHPDSHGLTLDKLTTRSSMMALTAQGAWSASTNSPVTTLALDFDTDDIGKVLTALGYEATVKGGKAQVEVKAQWLGSPLMLSLGTLNGVFDVDVDKGSILELNPGIGRLLGLVSIKDLPRRLGLDFKDVFSKGFGFDSITGKITLKNGSAYTDDLAIKAPSTDIHIKGRVGLVARDYDQDVTVTPHVGNGLPVIGALVGGPVGIVAGLAVQGVLGKGINKVAQVEYHIGGTWDNPDITVLNKPQASDQDQRQPGYPPK